MSHQLINRNADLLKLREDGYDISIRDGCLIVVSIPYLAPDMTVKYGALVSTLELAGDQTMNPSDHVMWLAGEHPHLANGTPHERIVAASSAESRAGITTNHTLSRKPEKGYADYYEKVNTYASMLLEEARKVDPDCTARPANPVEPDTADEVFNYLDTNSGRGRFSHLTDKFRSMKVGIVGMGGTGSYILDQVAKCPVASIDLYDADRFHTHNAFRAPGAASLEALRARPTKVGYFQDVYARMHREIRPNAIYVTEDNLDLLDDLDFVFVCIDRGEDKRKILEHLIERGTPFIDVGLGVQFHGDLLGGTVRATFCSKEQSDHILDSGRISFRNRDEDDYDNNIQIADMNALNAILAVIRWKKWVGIYSDQVCEHQMLYLLDGNVILNSLTCEDSDEHTL